jgi:hypothetical protein
MACAAALVLTVLAVNCEQVSDPLTLSQFNTAKNASMFSSINPLDRRVFYHYENILLSMEDLYPSEQTDIQIIRMSDKRIIRRLLVITDEYGKLTRLPIWNFINYNFRRPSDPKIESSGDLVVHVLQPGIDREWKIFSIPFEIKDALPPHAQIRVVDDGGAFLAASVLTGQPVYIEGSKLAKHAKVKLLVVPDRSSYASGDSYSDVTGTIEECQVDNAGAFPPTLVWASPVPGDYDVVADTAPYGVVNDGDMINEIPLTGLVVQNPRQTADIIQQIACDENGLHKDVFDSLEALFVKVNAQVKPWMASEFVNVFVAPHRDFWADGDSIVDMRTVGTYEMPIQLMWNGAAGSVPVTRVRGRSLPDDIKPIKMWPGLYDVILDMDRDYIYNKGYDILDGGPQVGFTVPGPIPPVRFAANANIDFLGLRNDENHPNLWGYFRDATETRIWGVLVDSLNNPIPWIPVKFKVIDGPGSLSRGMNETDLEGDAWSMFTGGQYGKGTTVRLDATVKDVEYTKYVLIFRKIPYSHNQGIIIGGDTHNQGVLNGY